MQFAPYSINKAEYEKLLSACSANTYFVVEPDQVPLSLPSGLMEKAVQCVIISSGGGPYVVTVINILRADSEGGAVDQEPFIVASSSGHLSAGFVHHGDWSGRSVYPGDPFFEAVRGSGVEKFYPSIGVPEKRSGSILEIKPDSHAAAFWAALEAIRPQQ